MLSSAAGFTRFGGFDWDRKSRSLQEIFAVEFAQMPLPRVTQDGDDDMARSQSFGNLDGPNTVHGRAATDKKAFSTEQRSRLHNRASVEQAQNLLHSAWQACSGLLFPMSPVYSSAPCRWPPDRCI